jgi:hypothetical protein
MSSRSEALSLYRDILRTARAFYWSVLPPRRPARPAHSLPRLLLPRLDRRPNKEGVPWCRVLRESARKEFEQARHEKDPLAVARMLVVGRQCVNETRLKFDDMEKQIRKHVDATRTPTQR